MGAWNYTYDTLNRLQAGTPTSGLYETPTAQYACFAYDSFGNRKAGAMQTAACPTPETSVPATVTYSATNQVTFVSGSLPLGLSYDGAGNVTSDGLNYYAYDGEGRLCAVENTLVDSYTQYVYDAGGTRVAKGASASLTCGAPGSNFSLTNQYLVGLGGEQVTELDGWGDWLHTDVWAGGRLLATYDGFGIHFPLTDPLGTKRIQANAYGAVDETCFSLPYGDGLNCIGDDATEHHFTGKERDTESGNDYFEARYYSSAMGRFLSPDWASNPEAVPYGIYTNPQTLNLYNYMRNNPLSGIDKDGHCGGPDDPCGNITVTAAVTKEPEVTSSRDGRTSTATVEGEVQYTVKNGTKPMADTPIHEEVSNKNFQDGKPVAGVPTETRDDSTNKQGVIGDQSTISISTNAPSFPGQNAAEQTLTTGDFSKQTTQTLTIGGTGCQVTETRTLSIKDGDATLKLTSPQTQRATPTPPPPPKQPQTP
jgi:RHS repeat-associated protein